MKKVLASLVIFALVAGTAFAQISGVIAGGIGFEGQTDSSSANTTAQYGRVRLAGSGETEDETFGGYIRLDRGAWWGDGDVDTAYHGAGWGWWKPNDMFRLTVGQEYDGVIATDDLARYSFYEEAGDLVSVVIENWDYSRSFYGGWADFGAIFTLTPMEGLVIHAALPFEPGADAQNAFKRIVGQINYEMDGLGKFALTIEGGLGKNPAFFGTGSNDQIDASSFAALDGAGDGTRIFAYFGLSSIENLFLEFGIGYTFESKGTQTWKWKTGDVENSYSVTGKVNEPLAVGVAAQYTATEQFGVKLRVQGQFAGNYKIDSGPEATDGTEDLPTRVRADILPYYQANSNLGLFFSAGTIHTFDDGKDTLGWHINPYIVLGNQWTSALFAGFRLESDGGKNSSTHWSIPVAISWKF